MGNNKASQQQDENAAMTILDEFIQYANLEHRKGQGDMSLVAESAIRGLSPAIIEGGTGNGKTFAYLVPLIDALCREPEKKAVISTATILLQEQLMRKDLPIVLDFFRHKYGDDVRVKMSDVVRRMGHANYICETNPIFDRSRTPTMSTQVKLEMLTESIGKDNLAKIEKIVRDAQKNGSLVSRRDIGLKIPYDVWDAISCKGSGGSCRCHEKGLATCAFKKTAEAMFSSPLIVVNHSFLVSNAQFLTMGRDYIVIDEAHKFPAAISSACDKRLSLQELSSSLQYIERNTANGVAAELYMNSDKFHELSATMRTVHESVKKVNARLNLIMNGMISGEGEEKNGNLFESYEHEEGNGEAKSNEKDLFRKRKTSYLKLQPTMEELGIFSVRDGDTFIRYLCDNNTKDIRMSLMKLRLNIEQAWKNLENEIKAETETDFKKKKKQLSKGWNTLIKETNAASDLLSTFDTDDRWKSKGSSNTNVYWFEKGKGDIFVQCSPLDLRKMQSRIAKAIFRGGNSSAIFVSATLSTNSTDKGKPDFSHFCSELGITKVRTRDYNNLKDMWEKWADKLKTISVPSQFDWGKQAKLIIPKDMQYPSWGEDYEESESESTAMYKQQVADAISRSVKHVDGNSVVLCSSMKMVDYISKYIEQNNPDIMVMNQANGEPVERMIMNMRSGVQPKKVLVGAQTLWQGIDLQGESLRGLFIQKVPFMPPDHPLTEERRAKWKQLTGGKSYFVDEALPSACMMFKQGIGRLLRSGRSDEYGVIVCFDPNFSMPADKRKPWVKTIYNTFPPAMFEKRVETTLSQVESEIRVFFETKQAELEGLSANARPEENHLQLEARTNVL